MKKKGNLFLYIGGTISGLMTALIILGFFWTPYSPTALDSSAKFQPPSAAHIMGTDNFGRDIFSRVLDGAGDTFIIALCVVAIGCVFGVLIGSICGYIGGVPDLILTRVCDSITAFPSFLLALVIVTILGKSTANIVLALGILFIPSFARTVRGEFARCRELNYIKSARLTGAGKFRIMFVHILPNTFSVLFTAVTIGFNNAVLSEASMSFLGIGIQPPFASLGSMLSDSQAYLHRAPWYALCTGAVIILLILGFSLLSEGLQRMNKGD
ncbi:MAG: ABC transporter permease [Oscillospiraceae bacterium]|nr:ABC transporter permease [Oscillospiraceae bacterium]